MHFPFSEVSPHTRDPPPPPLLIAKPQATGALEHRAAAARSSLATLSVTWDDSVGRTLVAFTAMRDALCARGGEIGDGVAETQEVALELDARVRAITRPEVVRRTYEQIMGQAKRAGSLSATSVRERRCCWALLVLLAIPGWCCCWVVLSMGTAASGFLCRCSCWVQFGFWCLLMAAGHGCLAGRTSTP
jgi:hypothetical protein